MIKNKEQKQGDGNVRSATFKLCVLFKSTRMFYSNEVFVTESKEKREGQMLQYFDWNVRETKNSSYRVKVK